MYYTLIGCPSDGYYGCVASRMLFTEECVKQFFKNVKAPISASIHYNGETVLYWSDENGCRKSETIDSDGSIFKELVNIIPGREIYSLYFAGMDTYIGELPFPNIESKAEDDFDDYLASTDTEREKDHRRRVRAEKAKAKVKKRTFKAGSFLTREQKKFGKKILHRFNRRNWEASYHKAEGNFGQILYKIS